MTKEETIKEMESVIRDILNPYNDKDPEVEAWTLVDQEGWRKQLLGTWTKAECSEKNGDATCSLCGHWDWSDCKYCSNCGAKMSKEN
jgi:hypothetical protein